METHLPDFEDDDLDVSVLDHLDSRDESDGEMECDTDGTVADPLAATVQNMPPTAAPTRHLCNVQRNSTIPDYPVNHDGAAGVA
jgi:hypothetical protein